MKGAVPPLVSFVCLVALLGVSAPAHAAFVAFVAPDGDPPNTCLTPADPCREIFSAIDKIDAGGTIIVAPGEYGAFGVDEAMHIIADEGPAVVGNSNLMDSTAIRVDVTASAKVLIRGFVANAGSNAIKIIGAGTVRLENCTFIGSGLFNFPAINFTPTGPTELYVINSTTSANLGGTGGPGILIKPTGSAGTKVVLENVNVMDSMAGIQIDGRETTGSNTVVVRNSVVSGNAGFGIYSVDSGGGATNVTIEGSTSVNNGQFGVGSNGVNSTVRVRNSTVSSNATGLQVAGSGKIISHGGNVVAGNTTNGAFTSTLPQQ